MKKKLMIFLLTAGMIFTMPNFAAQAADLTQSSETGQTQEYVDDTQNADQAQSDVQMTVTRDEAQNQERQTDAAADEAQSQSALQSDPVTGSASNWEADSWTWAEDYSTATVHLVDKDDASKTQDVTATITTTVLKPATCSQTGRTRYFAKAVVGSSTFVDWKTVDVPETEHKLRNPQWTWSEDYSTASVTLTCSVCGKKQTIDATVTKRVMKPATCSQEGKVRYFAAAKDGSSQWVDWKDVTVPMTDHKWSNPQWTWGEDYSTASVTLTCSECGEPLTLNAVVTKEIVKEATCEEDGQIKYTATATLNDGESTESTSVTASVNLTDTEVSEEASGTTWTAEKTETIPATGHDWSEPVWSWSEDYSTASATFTCANDPTHVRTVDAAVTQKEEDGKIVYTATVNFEGNTYTDTKEKEKTAEAAAAADTSNKSSGKPAQKAKMVQTAAVKPQSSAPKTGDFQTALWMSLIAGAGILMVILSVKRARRQ